MTKRKRILLSLLAVAVLAGVLIGGTAWLEKRQRKVQYQARREMETQLEAVCAGESVPGAAPYSQTPGLHRVLYVKQTPVGHRANFFSYRTPAPWEPETLTESELVACIVEQEVELQRCPYDLEDGRKSTIIRVQYQAVVTLRAAQSGAIIATSEVMTGGLPRECEKHEEFKATELTRYRGGARPNEAIDAWLKAYVEP